ncbi:MAG TPA: hypothetical protein VK658_09095 [Chryseolinea sp.]|nr:hypothetical protein [Chryseolinea sp.]
MNNFLWTSLYNCLYLISSRYREIESLQSPVFEIFEDLDTRTGIGLSDESLSVFLSEGRISEVMKEELSRFKDFLNKIESKYWNAHDFDHLEDWRLARAWAATLMQKLKMEKNGWNSDGEVVIYTSD